jgi:ATP-dependent Lhr-like helicase
VLKGLESGATRVHFVESTEPSVMAHEILNGKPYTFLDDAPLEERRTRAVQMRRGLPLEAAALARLDPDAVQRVRGEAAPDIRGPEELHDLLLALVVIRPEADLAAWFDALAATGRAMAVTVPGDGVMAADGAMLWCAVERRSSVEALFPAALFRPDHRPPAPRTGDEQPDADVAAADALRGHLDVAGPVTVAVLAQRTALAPGRVKVGLARLEAEGFAMRGSFDPDMPAGDDVDAAGAAGGGDGEQWCARRLLARIHSYTQHSLRREIEPVTAQDLMRFLLRWQHATPGSKRTGRAGVMAVVDQLQGFEIAAGAWEEAVLPARVESYQARWLEDLCLSGELVWGRLALRAETEDDATRRGSATPSRATPITFAVRPDLPWLLQAARGDATPTEPAHGAGRDVLDALRSQGAMFHAQLRETTGRLPVEVEEGLWDLVARGIVTSDGFQAVRSLLSARQAWKRRHRQEQRSRLGARRAPTWREGGEGRWALLPVPGDTADPDALAEQVAGQLLARWGVVFWDLMARENLALPWREVVWALRRLEARGLVRGGRFVTGFAGEQYALPEAVDELRQVRRAKRSGETVRLSAADPLNLIGIVLPGARVPAVRTNTVTYRDGLPVADGASGSTDAGDPDVPAAVGRP